MSKKLEAAFAKLAEALAMATEAAQEVATQYAVAGVKSGEGTGNGVAGGNAGSAGKGTPAAKTVAGKPAGGGKAKAPVVTFDDVKTALTELMNAKGKDAVKELMSEFGAAKLTEVEEANYADLLAKAKEAMAPDEEPAADADDDMFGE